MRHIKKSQRPTCLIQHGKNTNADFGNIPTACKKEIRLTLLNEQGYICAYCMQQISNDTNKNLGKPKTEIEHYKSQHRHPELVLDYKNMLGVCNGNADFPERKLICDKSKSHYDKTHDLFVNPLESIREKQIQYTFTGKIISNDKQIEFDLDTILNLNEVKLRKRREKLYRSTKKEIKALWQKSKGEKKKYLEKRLAYWQEQPSGKFRELCRVPLYLIEKELAKLQH